MDKETREAAGKIVLLVILFRTAKFWLPPFLIFSGWFMYPHWQEERQKQQRLEFVKQESVNWRDRAN